MLLVIYICKDDMSTNKYIYICAYTHIYAWSHGCSEFYCHTAAAVPRVCRQLIKLLQYALNYRHTCRYVYIKNYIHIFIYMYICVCAIA